MSTPPLPVGDTLASRDLDRHLRDRCAIVVDTAVLADLPRTGLSGGDPVLLSTGRPGPRRSPDEICRSPQRFDPDGAPSVYLAGQSIGCPDWQSETADLLAAARFDRTVLNPRPSRNPTVDPYAMRRGCRSAGRTAPFAWPTSSCSGGRSARYGSRISTSLTSLGRSKSAVVVGCDTADPARSATRAALLECIPWLPVEETLAATVTLARLSVPVTARP
ncbi:hypothetical protein [Kitasatospora sp. NPDC091207]|uniref:hypothetical protein n=1 Tax=Kitasatospora sp. NPDC091207 TaxID=3364083 RepID=UPI00382A9D78